MSNGTLTKCPKGHEVFALEGHPIVDGLPVCPTCLFKQHLAVIHSTMQLNTKVTELLEELKKAKSNGNLHKPYPRGQTPSLQHYDDAGMSAPLKVSSASTTTEEQQKMLADLELLNKNQENFIEEINTVNSTAMGLKQFITLTLRTYLSPKIFYAGKGIIELGYNTSGQLLIDNAKHFKIFVTNPLTENFSANCFKANRNLSDEEVKAAVIEHLNFLTDVAKVKLLQPLVTLQPV